MILTIDRHISMTTMSNSFQAGSWILDGFFALSAGAYRLFRLVVLLSLHSPLLLKMATNLYPVNTTEVSPDRSTPDASAIDSWCIYMITTFLVYFSWHLYSW